ncbi:pentapeptide repeat-containing protein [Prauserella flavalba]|uniref:Membrane-associated oxidoreductase n=1 Tax=Prauserella flavalba TaxID=1477506 RepID=A0A318LLD7_9PSEU|nr:pentapeptide repeat-containing protein [Prauserella flavalba]PXY34016.1 hypothetical protein BA062_17585 [Prauserella flavalba]
MPFEPGTAAGPAARSELAAGEVRCRVRSIGADLPVVEIRDAHVTGALDLRACRLSRLLRFTRCRFDEPPDLRDADLLGLAFEECSLPGLRAGNARVRGDIRLLGCEVTAGDADDGAVDLTDAWAGGSLVLTGSRLQHPDGHALRADRLAVTGSVSAQRLDVVGEVGLGGLRTGGDLDASGARIGGTLSLTGAHVGGDLLLRRARLGKGSPGEPIVEACRLRVGGDVDAQRLAVLGQVRATGVYVAGEVRLPGAILVAPGHDVLSAARGSVSGDLRLTCARIAGTVRLPGFTAGGDVDLSGSRLTDAPYAHWSLDLRSARVGGDLLLMARDDRPFSADSGVTIDGAAVSRRTDLTGAMLDVGTAPWVAFDAGGGTSAEFVLWPAEIRTGTVDLRRARCRLLSAAPTLWHATAGIGLLDFRYDMVSVPDTLRGDEGADLLRRAMAFHQPGPYDQLAAALRTSGEETRARTVLARKHQYRYAALADDLLLFGFVVRLWSRLQRGLVGYGYRPGRAVAALVVLLGATAVVLAGAAQAPGRPGLGDWPGLVLGCAAVLLSASVTAGVAHRLADRRRAQAGRLGSPGPGLPPRTGSGTLEGERVIERS